MTYPPRALRVPARFPITYLAGGSEELRVEGNCLDISESGLLGDFAQEPELWSHGEILLHFGGGTLGIQVRVARVSGRQAGIVFLYENAEQKRTIAEAVASATLEMERQGHKAAIPF